MRSLDLVQDWRFIRKLVSGFGLVLRFLLGFEGFVDVVLLMDVEGFCSGLKKNPKWSCDVGLI